MTESEKQIIAKLGIIKAMATETSVKQLADVTIEYIKTASNGRIGFDKNG